MARRFGSAMIANGVDLNAVTSYDESGLRVLLRIGRFEIVRLLLEPSRRGGRQDDATVDGPPAAGRFQSWASVRRL